MTRFNKCLRPILLTIVLASAVLIVAPPVAQAGKVVLGRPDLERIFIEIVGNGVESNGGDMAVSGFFSQPDQLTLPDETYSYRLLNKLRPNRIGRNFLHLAFFSGADEVARVKLDGTIQLFTDFVCLKRDIGRHAVLTEGDITLVRRDSGALGSDAVMRINDAVGKRMKATLSTGDILYSYHLEDIPLVKRGDLVTIVAQSGGFKVTAPGEARNSGSDGEEVRVKNLTSRRIIRGRVIGPGMVEASF